MNEQELREQGYIRIATFCKAMDTWARVCQEELPGDSEYRIRWRKEFSEHWDFIRLAILKSCLLDRLIYGANYPAHGHSFRPRLSAFFFR